MAEPEDQRGSGSTSTAATVEQGVVDGGVLATAKDKWSNQVVTEHHGNPVKLEPGFARAETHRRATTTVKRMRRQCCRPRGRKVCTATSRWIQASKASWLGAQGIGEAMTSFVEADMRYGDDASLTELWRRRREK